MPDDDRRFTVLARPASHAEAAAVRWLHVLRIAILIDVFGNMAGIIAHDSFKLPYPVVLDLSLTLMCAILVSFVIGIRILRHMNRLDLIFGDGCDESRT